MKPNVISIVLGGGRGSRLFPLTDKRSKPAVPIAGKYRLVDITTDKPLLDTIEHIGNIIDEIIKLTDEIE